MNRARSSFIGGALVTLIAGIVLLLFPLNSLAAVIRIFGFAVLLYGVTGIVAYFDTGVISFQTARLAYALAAAIAGIVMISNPGLIISIFPTIAGIVIAVQGIDNLLTAFAVRSAGGAGWIAMLALSVLTILSGFFVFSNPFAVQSTLIRVIGAILAYNGAVSLFGAMRT